MSEPETTAPEPIADSSVLDDPLTVAEQLRREPRSVDLDDLMASFENTSDMVYQVAEYEDLQQFEGRSGSHTIGSPGSAAWAQKIHEGTWRTQQQEIAEAEQREVEQTLLDPRLSDLGRQEQLKAIAKRYQEARQKQLAPVEQRVDEVLDARESAARRLVLGEAARDERTPEQRELAALRRELRVLALMQATAGLPEEAFMAAVSTRIRAGDPETPALLELATARLWATKPELARVLAIQAKGAARERTMATLRASPTRLAAVAEVALLKRTRERIELERKFYERNPRGQMPHVESTRG